MKLRDLAILFLVLFCAAPLAAQGLLDVNYDGLHGSAGDDEDKDVLARRETRRITIIDNTFMGISGLKDLRDEFEKVGWEATYREDTYVKELVKAASESDVLYIVTHSGVSQSTGQVGFVWRTFLGVKKNVLLSSEIAEKLQGKEGPALVVVAGCETARNETMARAFGGAYIGFERKINPVSAATWCRRLLEKIAEGQTYGEAFRDTPPITSFANYEGGKPRLIEPAETDGD